MKSHWSNTGSIWTLNKEDYNSLIFSTTMTFTFNSNNSETEIEKEEINREFTPGQMAFGVNIPIPELSNKFHLAIKNGNTVTVYKFCEFLYPTPTDAMMKNIPRAEFNKVSISYEGEIEYTLEEYRNLSINKILNT